MKYLWKSIVFVSIWTFYGLEIIKKKLGIKK